MSNFPPERLPIYFVIEPKSMKASRLIESFVLLLVNLLLLSVSFPNSSRIFLFTSIREDFLSTECHTIYNYHFPNQCFQRIFGNPLILRYLWLIQNTRMPHDSTHFFLITQKLCFRMLRYCKMDRFPSGSDFLEESGGSKYHLCFLFRKRKTVA